MKLSKANHSYLYAIGLLAVLVLAASMLHRLLLGSDYYVGNPLIAFEVAGVLLLLLASPVSFVIAGYYLLNHAWANAVTALAVAAISFLSAAASMQIDYPTLIFVT